DERCDWRDAEDLLAPLDDLIEHVPAGVVGAEEVLQRGGLVDRVHVAELLVRHEDRRDERENEEEHDADEADEPARAAREQAQELQRRRDRSRQRGIGAAGQRGGGHVPVAPPARPIRGSSRLYSRSASRFAMTTAIVTIKRMPCMTG